MPGTDLHTHLAPNLDDRTLADLPNTERGDDGRLVLDGHPVGPPSLYRPDGLEAYLDATGLDEAVVAVPPPFFRQHLGSSASAAWTCAINDGLLLTTSGHTRLSPLAYLPLEHPGTALLEYERIRDDPRWAGVTASAGGRSVSLADPELAPLWEALDRDGRTLLLHPGAAADPRLAPFYLANLLGNPAETAVAAAELVFGDIVARHPRLRFVLVHCGGTLPAVVGRWQHGVDTHRPGLAPLTEPPRQAVRRFYVDCLAHDPAVVDLAVTTFGADRLVLGSDWPFPMGTSDPAGLLAHRTPEYVEQVAVANADAALGRLKA
ncbi:amidohydrolase family protein [Streptomyces sp. NPDC005474]|uniref:amidohydrolase family protein n=1 Tax=Streptomyces sp. NPDC005474 TaxID=3154878 RepID=UPI003453D9F2